MRAEKISWQAGRMEGRVLDLDPQRRERWTMAASWLDAVGAARTAMDDVQPADLLRVAAGADRPWDIVRRHVRWAHLGEDDIIEGTLRAALSLQSLTIGLWRQFIAPLPAPPSLDSEMDLVARRLGTVEMRASDLATAAWSAGVDHRLPVSHALSRAAIVATEVWSRTSRRRAPEILGTLYISVSGLTWGLRRPFAVLPVAAALATCTRQAGDEMPRGIFPLPDGVERGTWEAWACTLADLIEEGLHLVAAWFDEFIAREHIIDAWSLRLPKTSRAVLERARNRSWLCAKDLLEAGGGAGKRGNRGSVYVGITNLRALGLLDELSGRDSYRVFTVADNPPSPPLMRQKGSRRVSDVRKRLNVGK